MKYKNWSDADLLRVFEMSYMGPAFYKTPIWIKAIVWIASTILPLLGIAAILTLLQRAPMIISTLVALGFLGIVCAFIALKREKEHAAVRTALLEELFARGLYEKSSVRISAPWE